MSTQWDGVFASATTPFAEDESLDLEALEAQLVRLVDGGIGGVVVLGPLGEGESLAPWERDAVVRRSVRAVGGRVPVLVAVGEPTTRGACHFAVECELAGLGSETARAPRLPLTGAERERIARLVGAELVPA